MCILDVLVLQSVRVVDEGIEFLLAKVEVEVACVAEDCSSSNVPGYSIFAFLDMDDVRDGNEQYEGENKRVPVSE